MQINNIAKTRRSRGYQLVFPINFSSDNKFSKPLLTNLDYLAIALNKSDQYKVIKKYQKPDFYNIDDSIPKQIGVFLDTETTGLSHEIHNILELGMVKFEYCNDGYVYKILDEFNQYQDPKEPISSHITELTGITDEMVRDKNINKNEVNKFLEDVDIIIAHNAAFDRPFFEKILPEIKAKVWGCSRADIDWKAEKLESQKLEYLAYKYKFFYEGHRAVTDCLAGLHLLAQNLPISKQPVLKQLLDNCHKTRFKIWAKNAPYETKDLLKARNYRWYTNYKAWMTEVSEDKLESELNYLRS